METSVTMPAAAALEAAASSPAPLIPSLAAPPLVAKAQGWEALLAKERCCICALSLGETSAAVIHRCKPEPGSGRHVFHKPCYEFVRPHFGGANGCPACAKELRAFPVGSNERDKEFFERSTNLQWDFTQELVEHPLDFGDCVHTHMVLRQRSAFVDQAEAARLLTTTADLAIDSGATTLLTPKEVYDKIRVSRQADAIKYMRSRSELVSHLQHVFIADAALLSDRNAKGLESDPVRLLGLQGTLASASSVQHALPGGGGYAGAGQAGFLGTVKNVWRRALDMDDEAAATEETVMTSSAPILLAGQSGSRDAKRTPGTLRLAIYRKAKAEDMAAMGYCAQDLISDGVTLAWLLRSGYTLSDLLILCFDWDLMYLAGLDASMIRQFKGTTLPIKGLCKYLQVGLLDVLENVCMGQVSILTQCDLSYEEASELYETSKARASADSPAAAYAGLAVVLMRWSGMTREDVAAFRWRLGHWHAAGLTLDMIKELGIDDEYACTILGWTPSEFLHYYRVAITELIPKTPQPPPTPLPQYTQTQPPPQPRPQAPPPAAPSPQPARVAYAPAPLSGGMGPANVMRGPAPGRPPMGSPLSNMAASMARAQAGGGMAPPVRRVAPYPPNLSSSSSFSAAGPPGL